MEYNRIGNIDIAIENTFDGKRKYIMINQWAEDNSYKWGIAHFVYDEEYDVYELQGIGDRLNDKDINWHDFGCLVNLGYEWLAQGMLD